MANTKKIETIAEVLTLPEFEQRRSDMEITNDTIKALHLNLDMQGEDFEFRSYSGRGMYGKECLALVTDAGPWAIVKALHDYLASYEHGWMTEETQDLLESLIDSEPSTDSMGYGTVYYWRHITLSEED